MRVLLGASILCAVLSVAAGTTGFVEHDMAPSSRGSMLDMTVGNIAWTSSLVHDSHAHVNGHFVKVENPAGRFSVVPPLPNGCGSVELVADTARRYNPSCRLAVNAGYYRILTDNGCIGNVVTDGQLIQTGNWSQRNVNFGVRNGKWVVGYVSPQDVAEGGFTQLIEGLGWLVHDGRNYVEQGWREAWTGAGAGGSGYAMRTSGRVAVGYNREGELIIMHIDGHTGPPSWGSTMIELADKLIELGAIEAINLDGGGSVTIIRDGVQMGYGSDRATYGNHSVYDPACPIGHGKGNNSRFECTRAVSTILCVHEVPAVPADMGTFGFWTPETAVAIAVSFAVCVVVGQVRGAKGDAGRASKVMAVLGFSSMMQFTLVMQDSYRLCRAAQALEGFSVFLVGFFMLGAISATAYIRSMLRRSSSAWRRLKASSYIPAALLLLVGGMLLTGVELWLVFHKVGAQSDSKTTLQFLLCLSQFLSGCFVGACVTCSLALVERLFPEAKRPGEMVQLATWCMLGLAAGPLVAVAVRLLKTGDAVQALDAGRVGPVQILVAIGCLLVLFLGFPRLARAVDHSSPKLLEPGVKGANSSESEEDSSE